MLVFSQSSFNGVVMTVVMTRYANHVISFALVMYIDIALERQVMCVTSQCTQLYRMRFGAVAAQSAWRAIGEI